MIALQVFTLLVLVILCLYVFWVTTVLHNMIHGLYKKED